jgi:hypothetical protein
LIVFSFGGGGDQGDPAEESTRPKPPGEPINLENPNISLMGKPGKADSTGAKEAAMEDSKCMARDTGQSDQTSQGTGLERKEDWGLEIYKGNGSGVDEAAIDDGLLELDLEEEVVEAAKGWGIAVYYSRKSFNPRVLFSDMLQAWGIKKLVAVDKIGC